jgi:single-strand DNA-binding protein
MNNDTPVTVVGNLTADPELGFTASGAAWCRFTVASTPRRFDKTSGEHVDGDTLFLRVTAWRDLAEHAAESLARGMRVVVTGRLRQSNWETPEGERRSSIDCDADDIGPSLRWATAKVTRTQRATGGHDGPPPPTDDPWTKPAAPASKPAGEPVAAGAAGYGEPPF